jgi:RNA polymerase sigma factor (sigma-70 family)
VKALQKPPNRGIEAELRRQLAALVLRRTALTEDEVELFKRLFPYFMATHFKRVWRVLGRRGIRGPAQEDLEQEVFLAFFRHACAEGFPENIPSALDEIAAGKASNHRRGVRRDPVSVGVPSSGREKPTSGRDILRALDVEEFRRRLIPALPPDQLAVVEAVLYRRQPQEEAASDLGIPRSTLASRLERAMRVIKEMAEAFFSPSQRH